MIYVRKESIIHNIKLEKKTKAITIKDVCLTSLFEGHDMLFISNLILSNIKKKSFLYLLYK